MSRARARVMRKGSTEPFLVDAWVEPATPDNNGPLVVQKWRDARGEYLTTMMVETMEEGSYEVGFLKSKYHLAKSAEIHAPYRIEEDGDKFKVVNDLGETKGTHDTWEAARQHQKALYANVEGASEMAKEKREQREKAARLKTAGMMTCQMGTEHQTITAAHLCDASNPSLACLPRLNWIIENGDPESAERARLNLGRSDLEGRESKLDDLLDGPANPEIEGEDPTMILNDSRAKQAKMVPIVCMTCSKRFRISASRVTDSLKCRCGSSDLDIDLMGVRSMAAQSVDPQVLAMLETDIPMAYVDEYQPQLGKLPENDTFAVPFKDESDEVTDQIAATFARRKRAGLGEGLEPGKYWAVSPNKDGNYEYFTSEEEALASYPGEYPLPINVTPTLEMTDDQKSFLDWMGASKTANGLVDLGGGWVQNGDEWLLFESEGVGEGDVNLQPRPGPVAEYNWSAFTYDTLPLTRTGVAPSIEEAKQRVEEYIRGTSGRLFARKKIAEIARGVLKTNPALGEKRAYELAKKTVDRFPQVIKGK